MNKRFRFLEAFFGFVGVVMFLVLPVVACKKAAPETLSEIMDRAANVTLVKYDYVLAESDSSGVKREVASGKVWVKQNRMRVENTPSKGKFAGYLIDTEAHTMYMWTPPENKLEAVRNAWEVVDFTSAMMLTNAVARSNPRVVGTETIDGKTCLVVEYGLSEKSRGKAWVWQKYPFLVRMELTQTGGTLTFEFGNIEFGDIPDSIFERP